MQDVPKGFQDGFSEGATSDETKKLARSFGKSTVLIKETAIDLAGDYKSVASEFTAGVREASKDLNQGLVAGLQETNKIVADTRNGVKDIIRPKDAEVIGEK
jgi:methyl-accepting chemotaxis protein